MQLLWVSSFGSIELWDIIKYCVSVGFFLLVLQFIHSWINMSTSVMWQLPHLKTWPYLNVYRNIRYMYFREKNVSPSTYMIELMQGFSKIFEKEGLIFFFSGNHPTVVLFKAETVEAVLSSSEVIQKSFEYKFLQTWLGTGLLTSAGDKWRKQRKLLTPAFHFRILNEFFSVFNDQSTILVEKLKQTKDKEWIDIVPLVTLCTVDVICESTMGVSLHAQKYTDSEYVKTIHEIGTAFTYRVLRPWLWNDLIYSLFPSGRKFKRNIATVQAFTRRVIQEKKAELLARNRVEKNAEEPQDIPQKKRKAFLELLLEHHIQDESLTEENIREEVDTFMFEGHDTTAMAVCWCLYNVGLCPEIENKIYEEMLEIFGDDKQRHVTEDDIKAMRYLDCVLKESLRLYPSVPIIGRHITQTLKIMDYTVLPGTYCTIVPFILHRDPNVFPNPEVFDPERFSPENHIKRHPYAYVPFSAGPRNCIGQRFALMEEKTILSHIFRNFKVKSLTPRDQMHVIPDLILRNSKPIKIKFTER